MVCNIIFPLNIIQHGFIHKQAGVMLLAWDIPNMAYLSITNANDYRNDIMTEQLAGKVVNLYRGYENKHSGSEYIRNNGLAGVFKYLLGMSYEQFKYENPAWIYQNYNRNYHMLIGSPNINREKIVDINVITNELFGLTAEEVIDAMAERDDEKVWSLLENFDYRYAYTYLYQDNAQEAKAYVERNPGLRERREEEYAIYQNGF